LVFGYSFKQYYKKRQSIYLDCLFLCLSFTLLTPLFLSRLSYAQANIYCKKLPISETVQYQRVFDGDTILLQDGRKIRLIGINSPELARKGKSSQAFAKKAKIQLKRILSAYQKINLSYDLVTKDKYNRTLAYVYLPDGTDVQVQMLRLGLATSIVIMPNEKNLNCYREWEAKARKKQYAIWQQEIFKKVNAKNIRVKAKSKTYRFVKGKVTSVTIKSQRIIVQLDNNLSIKLSGKAYIAYKEQPLLGRYMLARGLIYLYRKKPGMSIFHPANIKIDY
jgi:micrococcal nuclease